MAKSRNKGHGSSISIIASKCYDCPNLMKPTRIGVGKALPNPGVQAHWFFTAAIPWDSLKLPDVPFAAFAAKEPLSSAGNL